jgi:tyrosyl-tRNA synthetase
MELHRRNPGKRDAQKMLARLVTEIVHGKAAAERSEAVSQALFGERALSSLTPQERTDIIQSAPSAPVAAGTSVVDALVSTGLVASKGEARRLIEGNGISVSDTRIESADAVLAAEDFDGGLALLRRGRQVAVLTLR